MNALTKALSSPTIHAVLGAVFVLVFSWPIFAFEEPINTWKFMYGSWALGIGLIFLTARASVLFAEKETEVGEDGSEHV